MLDKWIFDVYHENRSEVKGFTYIIRVKWEGKKMGRYVMKRLLLSVVVFFGLTILVYTMSALAPGNPVLNLLVSPDASQEEVARITVEYGLDAPVWQQYLRWVREFLSGNLGISYNTFRPVSDMIAERIGPTLLLTVTATVLSVLIAVPLGSLAAYKPYSSWDYVSSGLAFVGGASPSFFVALMLIYFFCVRLGVLPLGGMYDAGDVHSPGSLIRHLILPAVTLSVGQMGGYIRQTRNAVLEVLGEDYIRTARSKGLREGAVVFRHALRNAMSTTVSQIGMSVPFLIGGSVVTEQIFGWPGLGSLLVLSVTARDYPVIMGIASVIAMVVLLANIIVDLIYGLLDPRIRYN